MKNTKLAKKHHYLPRYYLKGFTDNLGKFFVYDKETGEIFRSSPGATFFENNINTILNPDGSYSDFIERAYAQVESKSWESLDAIRGSSFDTTIESIDKMNLYLFLLFLYWRIPTNSTTAENLSKRFFSDDETYDYFKVLSTNGNAIAKDTIERIRALTSFKKSSRLLLPFAPFFKDQNWAKKLESWRFLYTGDKKDWYITGDNPIITRLETGHNPVNCLDEFIFPVSGRIILIAGVNFKNQVLPPEFAVRYGMAIIEKAKRFVAFQNRDFLNAIIKCRNLYVQKEETCIITKSLFTMLENN